MQFLNFLLVAVAAFAMGSTACTEGMYTRKAQFKLRLMTCVYRGRLVPT